jgi:hypothetical protein
MPHRNRCFIKPMLNEGGKKSFDQQTTKVRNVAFPTPTDTQKANFLRYFHEWTYNNTCTWYAKNHVGQKVQLLYKKDMKIATTYMYLIVKYDIRTMQ